MTVVRGGIVGACALMLWGCQALAPSIARQDTEVPAGDIEPVYDADTGALEQIQYRPEGSAEGQSWAFMDGTQVVRIEVDEDGDGQVDRWEHYGPQSQTGAESGNVATALQAALERVDVSTRRDGVVSRKEYYEGGMLVRAEEDTSGDGRIDKWETYADGFLEVLTLDTTADGRPDRRLTYDGGQIVQVEADPDGSGRFQALSDGR